MANESVVHDLEAFVNYDQGVFLEWIEGLGDLLEANGNPEDLDRQTLSLIGGLMSTLARAAAERGRQGR